MNDDFSVLFSRVNDALYNAENRSKCSYIGFLNEFELSAVLSHFSDYSHFFRLYGGCKNTKRQILAVFPEWLEPADNAFPILTIAINYKKEYNLKHSDFLGALTSLGIMRAKIGDIVVGEGITYVFLHKDIAEYVLSQIEKIGNIGVKTAIVSDVNISIEQQYTELSLTIASLRIDCIIAAICNTSRSKANDTIESDCVFINSILCTNSAASVNCGDTVTVRHVGKYVIDNIIGATKKGRLKLNARRLA